MPSIDLHGLRHDDAKHKVINFIEDNWFTLGELRIITGHSQRMKDVVIEVLKEYKIPHRTTNFFGKIIPEVVAWIN